MPDTEAEVAALVERELASISDVVVLMGIRDYLVPPTRHLRTWDYGAPGERYPCWSIASDSSTDTGIVYSQHGFGPRNPWGLVFLSKLFYGMDSGWFPRLEDAFVESFMAAHLPIWNVVDRRTGEPSQVVHSNLNSSEAFRRRDALKEERGCGAFHVLYRGYAEEGRS